MNSTVSPIRLAEPTEGAGKVMPKTYTVGFSTNPLSFPVVPNTVTTEPGETLELTLRLSAEAVQNGVTFAKEAVIWNGFSPPGVYVDRKNCHEVLVRQTNTRNDSEGGIRYGFFITVLFGGQVLTTDDPTIVNASTGGG